MKKILIVLSFLCYEIVWGQDAMYMTGLDIGLNIGGLYGNKNNAAFYNGAEKNRNKISFILGNKYHYNDIKNKLNCSDTFYLKELPGNMRYNIAADMGIYFRYSMKNYTGIGIQFNYAKLTAADVFSIEVDPNSIILSEPDIRLYTIWGTEKRMNIDISYFKYFKLKNPSINPYAEIGFNINNTTVIENKISIEGLEYSLINNLQNGSYIPGTGNAEYTVKQGGLGWGTSFSIGSRFCFQRKYIFDTGLTIYMQKINLENYAALNPNFTLHLRMSLSHLIFSENSEGDLKKNEEEENNL